MFIKNLGRCLFLTAIISSIAFGDWESDANTRIENIRKRNAEISVVNSLSQPVSGINVQIELVNHRFAFGTAIAYSPLNSNANYRNFILNNHFNWAVCENESKWNANEETRDVENYSQSDYIYTWCNNNGITMRGHTLFWEQVNWALPTWVQNLAYATYPTSSELLSEVDERIDSAVNHFKGKFKNWDVDNEMLPTGSDYRFYDRLGDGGRIHMYQRAKTVDPNTKFFMNEFTGNSFGGYDGWTYANRANGLISQGAPIDGLGIQGHVNSPFNPESYWTNVLTPLAAVGLPIWVTEYDTSTTNVTQRATDLENFYRICFSHSSVEGIIMWGFWDGSQWRADAQLVETDWTINAAGQRYEALMNEWTTSDTNTTDSAGQADFRGFHGTYEITLSAPGQTSEVYEIELEPGTPTALFVIETTLHSPAPDNNAPTPNPMTWSVVPTATGPSTITMTATTATDSSLPVQYYFECTNDAGKSSSWQTNTTYIASGLTPSTQYSFRVKARDSAAVPNETGWSSTQSATTNSPDTTPPTPNPMTWASAPNAISQSSITMTATTATDDSLPVQYYFECTNDASKNSNWQTNTTYVAAGLTSNTLYTFRVKARDNALIPNETNFSSPASARTIAPGADVQLLGSWTTGLNHVKESGANRILVFVAHGECSSGSSNLTSVYYSGRLMTKIIETDVGSTVTNHVAVFVLNEAGIDSAIATNFSPTWSSTMSSTSYTSAFFSNANQAALIGAFAGNTTTTGTNPITTSALSTDQGDMVIVAAVNGNLGSYTLNNGFTEGTDQSVGTYGHTGVAGHKLATGAAETPSATHSASSSRQAIIGMVIKAALPAIQNCSDVQAGGFGLLSDLNGDCFVNFEDLGIISQYWLNPDCGSYSNCEGADFQPVDGKVDFTDFSDFAVQWMQCNDPQVSSCTQNW